MQFPDRTTLPPRLAFTVRSLSPTPSSQLTTEVKFELKKETDSNGSEPLMPVPMQFSWMDSTYRLSRGNTSELLKDLRIYIVMRLSRGVVWSSPKFTISVQAWNIPSSWLQDLGGTWRGMKSIYWLSKHSMIHIPRSMCVKANTHLIQRSDVCNQASYSPIKCRWMIPVWFMQENGTILPMTH